MSPPNDLQAPASLRRGVLVAALAPFALGYLLSYLFRAVNAVVAPDLVRELGLSANELGFLTAAYLAAFALFQLPLGVLLDRFGPRRVQSALLLAAATGALLFSFARDAATLTLARGLIGLGFAGGLMASFKAVVIWVPEARRALGNACVMSFGALGLVISTAPMEWMVAQIGWRGALLALAAVTALVAATIFLVVPRNPGNGTASGAALREQLATLRRIFSDRAFLLLAPLVALSAGTHIAIQTLWAAPWFRDVAGYSRSEVANQLMAMAIMFFVGILGTGALADWMRRRYGVKELTVMLGIVTAFIASQVLILLDWLPLRQVAWLVFGGAGQVAILSFPWLSSHFGASASGRANTAMNLLIFTTAFLAQWLIGAIIDLYPRSATGGYPPEAFRAAFGTFVALELVALALYLANHRRIAGNT